MPRSIAELLPRPFDDLTLEDVARIVHDTELEQRETVFLEFKREPTPEKLAKSCAAFANTLGGLLLVGVTNGGEIVGCKRPAGEIQVWLKDTLRPRVTPLPPFRVRWLPMEGAEDRGLMLVLVERSSTTPHLLVNLGAVYIRNPGSSDPVPINDGRTLSELVGRGERAYKDAGSRIASLLASPPNDHDPFEPLIGGDYVALAATGTSAGFERELFGAAGIDHVHQAIVDAFGEGFERDAFTGARITPPRWSQDSVWMERLEAHGPDAWVGRLRTSGDGAVLARYAFAGRESPWSMTTDAILKRIQAIIVAGRQLLAALGAHGELLIGIVVNYGSDDRVIWNIRGGSGSSALNARLDRAIGFADDAQAIGELIAGIHAELARVVGIGPPN